MQDLSKERKAKPTVSRLVFEMYPFLKKADESKVVKEIRDEELDSRR